MKARAQCGILHYSKLNKVPCPVGDFQCYRTNPHHVLHGHSDEHVPGLKPRHHTKGKNIRTLFHQTSPENMVRMLGSSPGSSKYIEKWKRSQSGLFGEGIYCATSIYFTSRKAQSRGVVFCGEFDLGTVKEVTEPCPLSTYQSLADEGIDTLYARKGLQWGGGRTLGSDEYILTSQRQLIRGCWYVMDDTAWQLLLEEPVIRKALGESKQLYLQ